MTTAPIEVDAQHFRHVLGHFPTGVAVITADVDGVPYGMAANSFVSVSLRPPLVAFCADHGSTTWPELRRAGRFAANLLGAHAAEVCRRFSRKGIDRFDGVEWALGPGGSPLLADAIAWVDCVTEEVVPVGDHDLVVGRVRDLAVPAPGDPLVFVRGRYTRPAS